MKKFIIYILLCVFIVALCGWNDEPLGCLLSKIVACGCLWLSGHLTDKWHLYSDLGED